MLKKSLHYLIRCSFLLVIIVCVLIGFNSCISTQEDYFSFLKQDQNFNITVFNNEKQILAGEVVITYNTERCVSFFFTYPEALEGAKVSVNFFEDKSEYFFGEEELSSESVPSLWREIYLLFTPSGEIISAKQTEDSTVIESKDDNGTRTYTLNTDGKLKEINSGTLRISLKEEKQ